MKETTYNPDTDILVNVNGGVAYLTLPPGYNGPAIVLRDYDIEGGTADDGSTTRDEDGVECTETREEGNEK